MVSDLGHVADLGAGELVAGAGTGSLQQSPVIWLSNGALPTRMYFG